jgi:ribosomal protein S20
MKLARGAWLNAAFVLIVFAFMGCAQPPKEEEKAAKDAIEAAQNGQADMYAVSEWRAARSAFKDGETKLENKDYDEAKKLFQDAQEKAVIAEDAARRNKADLATELSSLKESVDKSIASARRDFSKLRKHMNKKSARNIDAMIKNAANDLADANRMLLNGKLNWAKENFLDASRKADNAVTALKKASNSKSMRQSAKLSPRKKK